MNSLLRSLGYLLAFAAACTVVHVVGDNALPNADAEAFAHGRIQLLIRDLHVSPSVYDVLPALGLAYEQRRKELPASGRSDAVKRLKPDLSIHLLV
jgi:hypothetical protein